MSDFTKDAFVEMGIDPKKATIIEDILNSPEFWGKLNCDETAAEKILLEEYKTVHDTKSSENDLLFDKLEHIQNELLELNADIMYDMYGDEIRKNADNLCNKLSNITADSLNMVTKIIRGWTHYYAKENSKRRI